jgi:GNAT superfamily N-acetyltransferase
MKPSAPSLYQVTEATWPPAKVWTEGAITLRDGAGGGKRVSAATCDGVPEAHALSQAEAAMRDMGQAPLFLIREGEEALDDTLDQAGYKIVDPVVAYVTRTKALTDQPIPRVTTFCIWEPLAMMREIWDAGGIGPARRDVMARAETKTGILARWNEKPAGAAFVGAHKDIAMVHVVEVVPHQRRQGVAQWIMRQAAFWAQDQGTEWLAVLCTDANVGANALYQGLGFEAVARYHYRVKEAR